MGLPEPCPLLMKIIVDEKGKMLGKASYLQGQF